MFFQKIEEKSGHSRFENIKTQPLKTHEVFNNPEVITEGWYPVFASKILKKKQVKSFKLLQQRIVLFRGEDGVVRAMDAFCPHMGADLGNGAVQKNNLQCYFHQWEFNGEGNLDKIPCQKELQKDIKINNYPVEEKYGYVWVFAGAEPTGPVPEPPGLEGRELSSLFVRRGTLYAHHHIMMASGIDLQHFSAVHNLDMEFNYDVLERQPHVYDWALEGELPKKGLKAKMARFLLGDKFRYRVRFAGGTMTAITYGYDQSFRGTGFKIPPLHVLWGATPLSSGVSQVDIFFVNEKSGGVLGPIKNLFLNILTFILLMVLKDEDIKAFPNMRFNPSNFIGADESVARLIQLLNKIPVSTWTNDHGN
jgi:nitrite reductase/ring-hydroxylating ferredoxin subunit